MLDVKEAAKKASDYFAALYPAHSGGFGPSDVRLEEVELTEDGQYWLITLSYPLNTGLAGILDTTSRREYKVFKIDAGTGQVKSMKIRKV